MFRLNRDERGFTLVELLIVVAILAVLVAIVAPNVGGLLGTGKEQAFYTDKAIIQTAVDAYYLTQNPNRYPTTTGGAGTISFTLLVTRTRLLREVPKSADRTAHPDAPGTGSYVWYVDSVGTITTTYKSGAYP